MTACRQLPTAPRSARRIAQPADQSGPTGDTAGEPVMTQPARLPTKLDRIEALLLRPQGTSIAELLTDTGWQAHSLRGAMAGALRKRGLVVTSDKASGERRYHSTKVA